MSGNKIASIFLISTLITGLTGMAFAESGNNNNTAIDKNSSATAQQSKDNQQADEQSRQDVNQLQGQNKTEGEQHSEYNQKSSNENNQNKTEGENQPQANQEGIDEINNENNNEKATHQENQQDANNIDDAKKNDTIAAEVDINNNNIGTQSIDNKVSVKTEHHTNDEVNITVNASSQTSPKVLLINLNSTTIDVASMKYIDVKYDGNHITPAANVDAVLHPASSDQPHYAILVTQSGAQILVSIPHFSTHTITVSKINKVMSTAVPEFPITLLVMLIAVTLAVTFYRIKTIKI
ncbi:MAG TPA: hypothetical protein VGR54_07030 [Nitrosopumilaceae archaeon]|nr:hypothetical protein [Nitrosopumilaceae archaeon]